MRRWRGEKIILTLSDTRERESKRVSKREGDPVSYQKDFIYADIKNPHILPNFVEKGKGGLHPKMTAIAINIIHCM